MSEETNRFETHTALRNYVLSRLPDFAIWLQDSPLASDTIQADKLMSELGVYVEESIESGRTVATIMDVVEAIAASGDTGELVVATYFLEEISPATLAQISHVTGPQTKSLIEDIDAFWSRLAAWRSTQNLPVKSWPSRQATDPEVQRIVRGARMGGRGTLPDVLRYERATGDRIRRWPSGPADSAQ